jgi:hypothetical protein
MQNQDVGHPALRGFGASVRLRGKAAASRRTPKLTLVESACRLRWCGGEYGKAGADLWHEAAAGG